MAAKKPLSPFTHEDHAALADVYEKAAKDAGATDPLAALIRREATQFLARITQALATGHIEPAMPSAPRVAADSPVRARPAVLFAPVKAGEFPDDKLIQAHDGAMLGARTIGTTGYVAVKALVAAGGNVAGDTFGAPPALAYKLITEGAALLVDPEALKVVKPPRR